VEAETPTFTFGSSIDLPGGATGFSSSSALTTLSVSTTDTVRRDRGCMIRRDISLLRVDRLILLLQQPLNEELKIGVGGDSESSKSRSGECHSESTHEQWWC
jgi:hypothetical protein